AYSSSFVTLQSACGSPSLRSASLGARILCMRPYSLLSNVPPFLEHQPLYNSISFDVGLQDTYLFDSPVCGSLANTTSFYQRLDTFLCPSSPQPGSHGDTGAVNYRVNTGSERWVTIVSSPNVGPLMCFAYASPSSV